MNLFSKFAAMSALTITTALSLSGLAYARRDYIQIVGSSTVYPFATVVAEKFSNTTDFKTPIIESTDSGLS